ncbi:hypothetical protein DFH07DRAFT_961361 [Mycena maculata]|uniref:SET domain-containing protein n=1 Tax=Mycena maculata TaxID=230809 RepID=A0AAD7N8F5_9AGAR|nr:hypothetical protein DFH07DRAFT_961361 [Mycena maculata]
MNMDAAHALHNTSLPENLAGILDTTYNPAINSSQLPFPKRPRPSELKEHIALIFDSQGAGRLMSAAARAASDTWDAYVEGSVVPTDFLHAPIGAPYRVAEIPGKGRGMVASRDLKAGEAVLMDSPLILLVKDQMNALTFLALPEPAIHAMLLLHNNIPNNREFSRHIDIPQHRLLDYLKGVATTNAFGSRVDSDGTGVGMILLAGSLFNHSNEPNVDRRSPHVRHLCIQDGLRANL